MALPPAYAAAVAAAKTALQARFGDRFVGVILYGSYAWGQPHEDSDVDLCVLLQASGELSHRERSDAMDAVSEVSITPPIPLSPLVWSTAELDERLRLEVALAEDIRDKGIRL